MRILHVVPTYLPAVRYGGPIVSVHGLCKALAARGHDVNVFTTNVDGPRDSDVPLGIPVDMEGVKVWYFPVPALRRFYWSPQMRRALLQQMRRFDIVHTHSVFLWPTWAAARIARRFNVPYVLAPRGMLVRALIRRKSRCVKRAWIALVERKNIMDASLIHFTSRLEAEEAAKLGLPIRRSCIVPNGVDLPRLDSGRYSTSSKNLNLSEKPYLLFVGRINWKKGLDRLITALPGISDCHLVVAGNDEERYQPELETLAVRRGVRERISFVGPVYGEDKAALFRGALLLVLPSYSENFGIVALEAMAEGCPVVVTPEVGAGAIVEELSGGLVAEGDPQSLASALQKLIADPSLRAAMGNRARAGVRARYSWDAIAERMLEVYRTTVAAKRGAR